MHSTNYERVAYWELELLNFRKARNLYFLLLLLRLPRLLTYLKFRKKEFVRLGTLIIVDGYFLEKSNYSLFSRKDIEENIEYLRQLIGINNNKIKNTLLHLRLGDFFASNHEKQLFLDFVLSQIDKRVHIITNEEDLLIECLKSKFLSKLEYCKVLSTANLSSIELLRFVSQYESIWYNGSTLLFWGSILGSASLTWKANLPEDHYVVKNCEYLDQLRKIFVSV